MKPKTQRLTIKLLVSDKAALERIAKLEGEAMAVVIRRLIRIAASQLDENGRVDILTSPYTKEMS